MSPSKRTDRKRRRRFAAPFVLTAALAFPAASCVVKDANPAEPRVVDHRENTPAETQPETEAPEQTAPDEPTNPPPKPIIVNPPRPGTLPEAPASGGKVHVRDNGTCWWYVEVVCPPQTKCNPPPPKQVKCPEDS